MTTRFLRLMAASALCVAVTTPAFTANLLTNGDFEAFTGPFVGGSFPPNGPITTSSATWNQWRVWPRFQSVDQGSLIPPTLGPTPFPTGWGGDNFAQHSQYLTPGTDDDGDYTDQIKQGIDGSRVKPGVPVDISFKYINTQPGRLVRVHVYGIDGNQVWSEFASFPCQYPQFESPTETCTLLFSADMPYDYSTGQGWKSFTGSFTPAASHDVVAVGITMGGNKEYARGVDDVVLSQDLEVPVDVKPMSCPNPINVTSLGVLPVAILGTDELDVTTIDPASVKLAGVEPLRSSLEDVATPYEPFLNKPLNAYACTSYGPDGYLDLVLHFDMQMVVAAIGPVADRAVIKLTIAGSLYDATPIIGEDVVRIINK